MPHYNNAMGLDKENLIWWPAIVGESSILTAPQGKQQGKKLVCNWEIFEKLDVLNWLLNALFPQAPSETCMYSWGWMSSQGSSYSLLQIQIPLQLNGQMGKMTTLKFKWWYYLDPEQVNQGDESFDKSKENDPDTNSALCWQASEQFASFLGTLNKPLSTILRHKFSSPDVDATYMYTPMLETYLISSLVPGVRQNTKRTNSYNTSSWIHWSHQAPCMNTFKHF